MGAQETIAAIATAPGRAALGVIRVSGADAIAVVSRIFAPIGARPVSQLASHTVHLGHVRDPSSGHAVDQALLTLYRAPHSYTGEDVAELSCHGGPVPLRRTLALLLAHGARLATPGEFTCRAFLNGKMDLAQAEAVADIIQASTDRGLDNALRHLEGRLSALVRSAREAVLPLVAHIEATLDFPEDVPEMPAALLLEQIGRAVRTVEELLAGAHAGRIYREGASVVIVGRPNVGKSSLLNALLREERAIVTDIPGTTRDTIEEPANIRGIPIRTVDTAGIRHSTDPIEAIGVERAVASLESADLVLAVLDASAPLSDEDCALLERTSGRPCIVVANKCDLPVRLHARDAERVAAGRPLVWASAREGTGLSELEERIAEAVLGEVSTSGDEALVSSARHEAALTAARDSLLAAQETIRLGYPLELVTTDLRAALDALGQITGESVPEEILSEIFGRFCIGK